MKLFVLGLLILVLSGCNQQISHTDQSYQVLQMRKSTVAIFYNNFISTGIPYRQNGNVYVLTVAHEFQDQEQATNLDSITFGKLDKITVLWPDVSTVPNSWRSVRTPATMIYANGKYDFAIIQIDDPSLLSNYDWVDCGFVTSPILPNLIGSTIFHVGNFAGVMVSFTQGTVSNFNDTGMSVVNLANDSLTLYTTNVAWQGSSGGPIFNQDGKCIAIVQRVMKQPALCQSLPLYYVNRELKKNNIPELP